MGLRSDLLCILLVVLGNPVLWKIGVALQAYNAPDASAYGSLSRVMASDGLLYLKSWGYTDQGLILPPLLPAMMAVVGVFTDDPLRAGAWVSGLSALICGVALYLLLSRLSNRVVAVVVILGVQTGYHFYYFAFAPLSEALFTMVAAWTLVALLCCSEHGSLRSGIVVGLCCALVLLSRKAGLFVAGASALWLVVAAFWNREVPRGAVLKRGACVAAGMLLIVGPYAAVLYAQTGQHPLQPRFRMGDYVVGTDDPAVIAEIEAIQAGNVGAKYRKIYRSRRAMRKLLPDGSEMYAALSPMPGSAREESSVVGRILGDAAGAPVAIFERLWNNVGRLRSAVGWPMFALFLVTSISPLAHRARSPIPSRRFLLPLFIWTYLVGVSIVTDLLDRYVVVVIPFVVLQGAAEVHALAGLVSARRFVATAVALVLVGAALVARPRHYTRVRLQRTPVAKLAPYAALRAHLPPGAPVLAAAPLDALLLGASYRALPNARLDLVARYAHKTGVD
ncbi:MAG: glycosyltransferase family 39 protein [Deltaproteobacteria bacterium]|nr:glycosyltransferase family 39 protein [Deltaproteobacteria bacterium]